MTPALLATLCGLAVIAVALFIWLIPNRKADLERIDEVRQRRESDRAHELTAIDADIASLARRRERLLGEDR